jgi:hypothetical protein
LPKWNKGDIYNYLFSRVKIKEISGSPIQKDSISIKTTFKVIDSDKDTYTISYAFENEVLKTVNINNTDLSKFGKYQLTEIIYRTTNYGRFMEVLNYEEISKKMEQLRKELLQILGNKNLTNDKFVSEKMESLFKIYTTKEGIEKLVMKDLQCFHMPYGIEFTLNKPILFEESLPNVLGGEPMRGDAEIVLIKINEKEKEFEINYKMITNNEDTKKFVFSIFDKMQLPKSQYEAELKNAYFSINDNSSYIFNDNFGIPKSIKLVRESTINLKEKKAKSTEKFYFKLL